MKLELCACMQDPWLLQELLQQAVYWERIPLIQWLLHLCLETNWQLHLGPLPSARPPHAPRLVFVELMAFVQQPLVSHLISGQLCTLQPCSHKPRLPGSVSVVVDAEPQVGCDYIDVAKD
jgi:hypothetical protein